ncbi:MAG: septum formation initiator family protein [Phocaeicola sp.]|nr:septum formation initiator family protein [Phocaeicola sp.]
MSKLKSVWNFICQHKYLITIVVFLVIIVFLDENNLINRFQHKNEIRVMKSDIEEYRKQFNEDTERLKELTDNPEGLEKIAREKYLMKKPNEDIFILEE